MAAPVLEGFETNTSGSALSITINKPSGVVSGDLLLAILGVEDFSGGDPWGTPTGWTKLGNVAGAPGCDFQVFYRVSDGSEGASETFSHNFGFGVELLGWYIRISGVDTTTPINVFGTSGSGSGSSIVASSVTTTAADCLAFAICAFDGSDGLPYSISGTGWPSTIATNQELASNTGGSGVSAAWVVKTVSSAGSSENATFTASASDDFVSRQLAIAPAAGGGGLSIPVAYHHYRTMKSR